MRALWRRQRGGAVELLRAACCPDPLCSLEPPPLTSVLRQQHIEMAGLARGTTIEALPDALLGLVLELAGREQG